MAAICLFSITPPILNPECLVAVLSWCTEAAVSADIKLVSVSTSPLSLREWHPTLMCSLIFMSLKKFCPLRQPENTWCTNTKTFLTSQLLIVGRRCLWAGSSTHCEVAIAPTWHTLFTARRSLQYVGVTGLPHRTCSIRLALIIIVGRHCEAFFKTSIDQYYYMSINY